MTAVDGLGAVLLALAGLLVLMLVLFLVVPLRLSLRLASDPPAMDLAVGWPAAWLPAFRLSLPRTGAPPRRKSRARKPPPDAPTRRPGRVPLSRALRALPRLLASALQALHLERLSLSGRFGTGDPALTGQIYGAVTPVVYGTAGLRRVDLRVEPDFHRAGLSADGLVVLRIRPIALAGPLLRFAWACCGPGR